MTNATFVTGLWDLNRGNMDNTSSGHDWKRSFDKYLTQLKELLSTGLNIVVYGDVNIQPTVAEYSNALFVHYPQDNFKNKNEFPFFEQIDALRTCPEWYDQPTAQWLKSSPQAVLPLYIPITMSKLLLVQKTSVLNPFNTTNFYWLDAGITKNHAVPLLRRMVPDLLKYKKFIFFSHYYSDNTEVHGFLRDGIHRYCGVPFVSRIMKGFFFGGETSRIDEIVDLQTSIITKSLNENLLGTEESYFTIMESQCPDLFDKVLITDCSNVMRFL
jgi:hypothetical protein